MEEDSRPGWVKWVLGAVGLGAIGGSAAISIWIAIAILVLALLLFGGLLLLRWWSRKRKRGDVISGVGQGAGAGVSQAEQRAELDSLLQRFRDGLKEFDRAGYSVYDYPWFVVIGESGAGKTEAVRSALEDQVPSSVRHHIPPRDKGTKDFVWWFTKHGIVLDTAGRMVVGEGGASNDQSWRLFLKSLRKARSRCPINGLLLALSAESLIKDSSEQISEKARQLQLKIESIQNELDVRFPVYVLVTKCDLLTGFREFTEKIEDPQLQHQVFGWSNPAPLDEKFRPELVGQHLLGVVEQIKRRRLALLRPADGGNRLGDTTFRAKGIQLGQAAAFIPRRMDENDALFAFPDSLMRLEPRLRRYLETIFVGGEWSAKPVFLRGIYFTSAMREGAALDEAMSLITGVPVGQMSDERPWERNKSFFLRDLFAEKVVAEKGLVTRAKNTLRVLKQRQYLIFGSATVAMLLLLGFAWFGYRRLVNSVGQEEQFWKAAANNWSQGEWAPEIVQSAGGTGYRYAGDQPVLGLEAKTTVLDFHKRLQQMAAQRLHVPIIFQVVSIFTRGLNRDRIPAQQAVLVGGIVKPLFERTRDKMRLPGLDPNNTVALKRHQDALLELLRLEGAALNPTSLDATRAEATLRTLLSYLTETDFAPDTNLVRLVAEAYRVKGSWPPRTPAVSGGTTLANNPAIEAGLRQLKKVADDAGAKVDNDLTNLDDLVKALQGYNNDELQWFSKATCDDLPPLYADLDRVWSPVSALGRETNLTRCYSNLMEKAFGASASPIAAEVSNLLAQVPEAQKAHCLIKEVDDRLHQFSKDAVEPVVRWYSPQRSTLMKTLDQDLLAGWPRAFEVRWNLYTNACALSKVPVTAVADDMGGKWQRFQEMMTRAKDFNARLEAYQGPARVETTNACSAIASKAVRKLKSEYVQSYRDLANSQLKDLTLTPVWDEAAVTNARVHFVMIEQDLNARGLLEPEDQKLIQALADALPKAKTDVLAALTRGVGNGLGFPIMLGTDPNAIARTASELRQARKLAGFLGTELSQPVWGESAAALRTTCGRYAPVLNMLLDQDGHPTEWILAFVGPPETSQDYDVVAGLRALTSTNGISVDDLTKVKPGSPKELGTFRADAELELDFKRNQADPTATQVVQKKDWWLARFLVDSADTSYPGPGYRFKVPLAYEEGGKKIKGDALFQVIPKDTRLSVATLKDWKGVGN